jgi:hypothetical protein
MEQRVAADAIANTPIWSGWIKRFAFEVFKNCEDVTFDFKVGRGGANILALHVGIQISRALAQDPSRAPLLLGHNPVPSQDEERNKAEKSG